MRHFEGGRTRRCGKIVALVLLTVATAPRVAAAQTASATVTRTHVLTGTVEAVMATDGGRLRALGELPPSAPRPGAASPGVVAPVVREWLFEGTVRTNAPAQPLLRASALRGAWWRRTTDGTWVSWDGRETAVGAPLGPGRHAIVVPLRGPAGVALPEVTLRVVPAPFADGVGSAPGAFGAPRR